MTVKSLFATPLAHTILVWIAAAFFAVMVAILIHTIYYRIRNYWIEVNMRRLKPVFKDLISNVRYGNLSNEEIGKSITRRDFRYFERFLRDTISDTSECDVVIERLIADQTGFTRYLRDRVKCTKGWKQALNLRALSYFRSKENIPVFRSVIRTSRSGPSILAAGLGLALCDDYDAMGEVFKKIYDTTNCNEDVFLMVAAAYGSESSPYLHKLIKNKKLNINEQCVMVDALGVYRYKPAVETLKEKLFSTKSVELGLHIMDALKWLGDETAADDLLPFLGHKNYFMRVKTALTVSVLGGAKYIGAIEPLLSDRKWWVRRNAAEAILNTGREGLARLKQLAGSADEFPRTASQLILTDLQFNKLGAMVNE